MIEQSQRICNFCTHMVDFCRPGHICGYIVKHNGYTVYSHYFQLGVQQSIQFPTSTSVTSNNQPLLPSDQQNDLMSHSE